MTKDNGKGSMLIIEICRSIVSRQWYCRLKSGARSRKILMFSEQYSSYSKAEKCARLINDGIVTECFKVDFMNPQKKEIVHLV